MSRQRIAVGEQLEQLPADRLYRQVAKIVGGDLSNKLQSSHVHS